MSFDEFITELDTMVDEDEKLLSYYDYVTAAKELSLKAGESKIGVFFGQWMKGFLEKIVASEFKNFSIDIQGIDLGKFQELFNKEGKGYLTFDYDYLNMTTDKSTANELNVNKFTIPGFNYTNEGIRILSGLITMPPIQTNVTNENTTAGVASNEPITLDSLKIFIKK